MVSWFRRRQCSPPARPLSPSASRAGRRRADLARSGAGAPWSPAGLATSELCALWRKSSAGLRAAATPAARAAVVAARGALLDELERREPEAMARWLATGAREPEGPSDYLLR